MGQVTGASRSSHPVARALALTAHSSGMSPHVGHRLGERAAVTGHWAHCSLAGPGSFVDSSASIGVPSSGAKRGSRLTMRTEASSGSNTWGEDRVPRSQKLSEHNPTMANP